MSLWSSGQRKLERREVLVLPPRGRVGWSFSLVWAFGESTRILIYVIRIVHKLPLKLIYEGEYRPALSVWTDDPKIYGYKADGPVICMLRENRTGFKLI